MRINDDSIRLNAIQYLCQLIIGGGGGYVVLKELSQDRLFSSAVRSEQQIQLREIIDKNIDRIETFPSNEPKDLSKDEVVELVSMVKKEISRRKDPES